MEHDNVRAVQAYSTLVVQNTAKIAAAFASLWTKNILFYQASSVKLRKLIFRETL